MIRRGGRGARTTARRRRTLEHPGRLHDLQLPRRVVRQRGLERHRACGFARAGDLAGGRAPFLAPVAVGHSQAESLSARFVQISSRRRPSLLAPRARPHDDRRGRGRRRHRPRDKHPQMAGRRRVDVERGRQGRRVRHLPRRVRRVSARGEVPRRRLARRVGTVRTRVPPAVHHEVAQLAGGAAVSDMPRRVGV
eukprot:30820-Pelagococcus_subviridis.AAC.2